MRRAGFTLIELLICSALSLSIAALCVAALGQTRLTIRRTEARLAMYADAQTLYHQWHRLTGSMMQEGALELRSRITPDPGSVEFTFLRGKEDSSDWDPNADTLRTDLAWERWTWDGAARVLYVATSSPNWWFKPSNSFTPTGSVQYQDQGFINLPQPRRWLSSVDPDRTLDDNAYFRPAPGAPSAANPVSDIGDAADLLRNRRPILNHVSAFSVQLLRHDGGLVDCTAGTDSITVIPGVWPDGRLAPRSTDRADFTTSDVPGRPRLLRVRFTLSEPRLELSQTFSFSFALPALAPAP